MELILFLVRFVVPVYRSCSVSQMCDAWEGGGGVVFPYKRLMGMCRWMGSHFHDWID